MSWLANLAVKGVKKALAAKTLERTAAQAAEHRAAQEAEQLAVKRAAMAVKPKPKALPAPHRPLALPAPGPRPDPVYKPRGGQWWPDAKIGPQDPVAAGWRTHDRGEHAVPEYRHTLVNENGEAFTHVPNPEAGMEWAARYMRRGLPNYSPDMRAERDSILAGLDANGGYEAENWLKKALAKYYKNDLGTANDPLADLAERGLHYDPAIDSRQAWHDNVNAHLMEDRIGDMIVPPHAAHPDPGFDPDTAQQLSSAAPWLAKQPVTDKLYGLRSSPIDAEYFGEQFVPLLHPEVNGTPAEFAVRPDSLPRMTFPQAVERVGQYRQWQAKEAERKAAEAMNNPALSVHKDYGDGMRWVKIGVPEKGALPEGWRSEADAFLGGDVYFDPDGGGPYLTHPGVSSGDREGRLAEALRAEGDAMGHCVGGYCNDVMYGGTGIYSLRDAKGQPHVTIETSPAGRWMSGDTLNHWGGEGTFGRYREQMYEDGGIEDMHKWAEANFPDQYNAQNIEQIKGKQNAKPIEQYLPYVQDFVKSQPWAAVNDLRNAGMVRLPDKRFITEAQLEEGLQGIRQVHPDVPDPYNMVLFNWPGAAPYFEGYAKGGLVKNLAVKGGCGCQHS